MINQIQNKLKAYSVLASAVLSSNYANADIVYKDINPDITLNTNGQEFILDINNDLNVDLYFKEVKSPGINYIDVYGYSGVAFDYFLPFRQDGVTPGFADWYFMNPFSYNEEVGYANSFTKNGFLGWQVFGGSPYSNGLFDGLNNHCVGFKMFNAGETHYGWARVDVGVDYSSITIKDYAYNDIPDSSIACGVPPILADSAQNLLLQNLNINGGASDLKINFDTANSEFGLKEYRIFIVKQSDSASINLNFLRYNSKHTSILPNGNNISLSLSNTTRDVFGNFITGGETYRFIVLSVPDYSHSTNHQLSTFSNQVTLQLFEAQKATNLEAIDAFNLCNSSDLQIKFDKATEELGINEYRVIIVKEEQVSSFDLSTALQTTYPNFIGFPTGNNVNQVMPNGAFDSDGDSIKVDVNYQFFVLSLADGISKTSSLSLPSNVVKLSNCNSIEENLFFSTHIYSFEQQIFIRTDLNLYRIKVFNTLGNLVFESLENNFNSHFLMNNLEKGIYFVELEKGNLKVSKKIIL